MKELRVLHIASFEGNVGDNANHNGTRRLLRKNLSSFNLSFDELEIREFFWKKRFFDDDFAELANQYDLLIFGGGNFFELWVEDSSNSTSVDISIEVLEKINTRIIFYSLGMDPAQGIANIALFKKWVDYVISKPEKYILSVRNDGALETIEKHLGKEYLNAFHWVPDGGFFVEPDEYYHPEIDSDKKTIGINIAGDMLDTRFPQKDGHISSDQFLQQFSALIDRLLEEDENLRFLFFAHIYKDLDFISSLFKKVNDWNVRRKITVAPYLHGKGAEKYIFNAYQKCDLIIGNRFHTNVCAIGLGVPSIGLVNYRQIEMLYKELDMADRYVEVNKVGFDGLLHAAIQNSLSSKEDVTQLYAQKRNSLIEKKIKFHNFIHDWLKRV